MQLLIGHGQVPTIMPEASYKIDDITRVNLEEFLSHASLYLLLYHDTDSEVKEIVNKIKQIIISNCTIIMPEDAPHKEFLFGDLVRKKAKRF